MIHWRSQNRGWGTSPPPQSMVLKRPWVESGILYLLAFHFLPCSFVIFENRIFLNIFSFSRSQKKRINYYSFFENVGNPPYHPGYTTKILDLTLRQSGEESRNISKQKLNAFNKEAWESGLGLENYILPTLKERREKATFHELKRIVEVLNNPCLTVI